MRRRLLPALALSAALSFAAEALAQPAADAAPAPEAAASLQDAGAGAATDPVPENPAAENPGGTAGELLQAIEDGRWIVAVGLALFFVIWAARAAIGAFTDWAATKVGGYAISFGGTALFVLATSLAAGEPPSWGIAAGALGAAFAAGGQLEGLHDFGRALWRRIRE